MTKNCTKCGEEKPATKEFFYANKSCSDGLNTSCKICRDKQREAYRSANMDKFRAWGERRRRENPEILKYSRDNYRNNKGRALAYNGSRRARKEGRVHVLCDKMIEIYDKCVEMNERDGSRTWHVDHIVPFSSGGDHVAGNLQIVPGEWNMAKKDNPMCWNDLS